jgi:hypothetical protein
MQLNTGGVVKDQSASKLPYIGTERGALIMTTISVAMAAVLDLSHDDLRVSARNIESFENVQ